MNAHTLLYQVLQELITIGEAKKFTTFDNLAIDDSFTLLGDLRTYRKTSDLRFTTVPDNGHRYEMEQDDYVRPAQ